MYPDDLTELQDPKNKNRLERWENIGVAAIETDLLENEGRTYIGPEDRHELARIWIAYKKSQPKN